MIRRLLCRLGLHRWQPTAIDFLDVPHTQDAWLVVSHCKRPGCCETAQETRYRLDGLPVDLIVSGFHQAADAQERTHA